MEQPAARRILLIAPNANTRMGGEAIKAWQYFNWLLQNGHDAVLLTHGRNRADLDGVLPVERIRYVEETALQGFLWRSRLLRIFLGTYFHLAAARIARCFDPAVTVLHYICPISPVEPRFPPRGYRVVIGPLSGNIVYPPAFRDRMGRGARLSAALHGPVQRVLGLVLRDKRRAEVVLVSGQARARASLRRAGVRPERMVDVLDAGVTTALEPARHDGRNPDFVSLGRLIALKGNDLAIRALAAADPDLTLTIHGEGPERAALERLAESLGVAGRVRFAGWLPHAELGRLRAYRGLIFPTLCESNGIAMQEAMMLGLPVVTLRWAGPAALADDSSAVYIAPDGPEAVVAGLAAAMNRLAGDPAHAAALGAAARARAEAAFDWDRVAASWAAHYAPAPAGRP